MGRADVVSLNLRNKVQMNKSNFLFYKVEIMRISRRKERSRKRIRTFTFTRTTKHKMQLREWLFGPIAPSNYKNCSLCVHEGTHLCLACMDYENYKL